MRCGFGSDAKRGLRAEGGAVAVELALCVPVLLLLLAGLIDFGWSFYWQHSVTNASRAGARYGVQAKYAGGIMTPHTADEVTKLVKDKYGADLGVIVDPPGSSGTPRSVEVDKTMQYFFLGFFNSLGVNLPTKIKNTTTMTME